MSRLRTLVLVCAVVLIAGCRGGDSSSAQSPAASAASISGNSAPKISGTAASAAAINTAYSFVPAASDVDGDILTFQIQNKPSWATFNTVTGQLTGKPGLAQIGAYANIVISASDGKQASSLAPFAINVKEAPSNEVELAWIPPVENVDGTPLVDLAGFLIAYGEDETALAHTIHIDSPGIDRYTVSDLEPGTYYFGVKAVNTSGAESELSPLIRATIE